LEEKDRESIGRFGTGRRYGGEKRREGFWGVKGKRREREKEESMRKEGKDREFRERKERKLGV
jgi:hypothetical protein